MVSSYSPSQYRHKSNFGRSNATGQSATATGQGNPQSGQPNDLQPCQIITCPEVEMTDYDHTQAAYLSDVEMADAPLIEVDISKEPTLQGKISDGAKRDLQPIDTKGANDTQVADKSTSTTATTAPQTPPPWNLIKSPTTPPENFELLVYDLLQTRKIYSISHQDGRLEVTMENA
ncbi:hypothetical protein F5Y11DRAFT_183721 [Daldinia sp. FL1419]|nr:hypothetical protein F5Y11DRAFT_183721 [Daldinia sp. FL1419]